MFDHNPTPLRTFLVPPPKAISFKQFGSVAIEFALAFPLFFALFYAIVGYSLVMTIQQSMTQASKEGIRAAIKADRTAYPANTQGATAYQAKVTELARSATAQALAWMPNSQKSVIIGSSPSYDKIKVDISGSLVTVTLTYPYTEAPLLPVLSLPLIGDVPNIPESLVARSDGQL